MITGTRSRARRRKLLNRVLTIGATIVLAAGLAMVWVRVVQTLTAPRAIGQPGALVWDGRVFETPSQLKAYLTSRGLSYARWSARHPTAFGEPVPAAIRHTTSTKTVRSTPKPKPTTNHRVAAPSVIATHSNPITSIAVLAAATAILLGFGVSFYLT